MSDRGMKWVDDYFIPLRKLITYYCIVLQWHSSFPFKPRRKLRDITTIFKIPNLDKTARPVGAPKRGCKKRTFRGTKECGEEWRHVEDPVGPLAFKKNKISIRWVGWTLGGDFKQYCPFLRVESGACKGFLLWIAFADNTKFYSRSLHLIKL